MKKKKKRSTRKEKQGDQTTIIHLFQSHAAAAGRTPHTPPMDRQTDGWMVNSGWGVRTCVVRMKDGGHQEWPLFFAGWNSSEKLFDQVMLFSSFKRAFTDMTSLLTGRRCRGDAAHCCAAHRGKYFAERGRLYLGHFRGAPGQYFLVFNGMIIRFWQF